MDNDASRIISRLIDIEENVGKLYRAFASAHPTDFKFWINLASEEDRHANIIRANSRLIIGSPALRKVLFSEPVDKLKKVISKIMMLLESFEKHHLPRLDCFTIAIQIEQSAGEIHLQNIGTDTSQDIAVDVIRGLLQEDHEHAQRIKDYMAHKLPH